MGAAQQLLAGTSEGGYTFTDTISVNKLNYNLATAATAAGWNGTDALLATVTINSGIYVYSNSTGTAAFASGAIPADSTLALINNGHIMGMGGAGACYNNTNVAGTAGGQAMNIDADLAMTITNGSGHIYGGGGGGGGSWLSGGRSGGGGGAGGGVGGYGTWDVQSAAGGAGGGVGAAGADGAIAGGKEGIRSAGGGGRIYNGSGGVGAWAVTPSPPGRNATGGGAGGGGSAGSFDDPLGESTSCVGGAGGAWNAAGGTGSISPAGWSQGAGGGGGGWGLSGGAAVVELVTALAAGAGGKAIELNGGSAPTWVSGSGSPNTLGTVS